MRPHALTQGLCADEGVMTASYTTDETDDARQANIVAAGYGR